MAISEAQKVDFLWKKLGYGVSKTDTNANKKATNESISSPLLLRGNNVWSQADQIPGTMPASSSGVVTVYPTTSPDETTADASASTNRTWKTGLTDWIPPEIGSTYLVKVYVHTAGDAANAAGSGTQLFGAGSGNNDEWFFDYQSGTLHFIGTNLPNGINFSGKSIYVSGARYSGIKGVSVPGSTASFTDVDATGIGTFQSGGRLDDIRLGLTAPTEIDTTAGNLILDSAGGTTTIDDDASITGNATITGDLDVDGHTDLDDLIVAGVSTFSANIDANGNVDIAGNLDVDGHTELDDVNISGVATATALHLGAEGSAIRVTSDSITGPSSITIDPAGVGDNTGTVFIAGNLQVDGTQTTINSTTVNIDDKNIQVATGAANDAAADGGGITVNSGDGDKTFQFEATGDNFGSSENLNLATGKAYKISNTTVLNADTLGSGILNSSLRTVGTLTGLTVSGNASIEGNVDLGNQTTDTITATGRFDSNLLPSTDDARDLGSSSNEWRNLFIDGTANIDALVADTADIDGGTIDGAAIGANSASTGAFTTISASSNLTVTGDTTVTGDLDVDGQTDLDDVSIAGVTTHAAAVTFSGAIDANSTATFATAVVEDLTDNRVVIAGAGGELEDDGNLTFDGSTLTVGVALDVDGQTDLDILNVAELATFSANIDANGNLDVDGHTELDDVNIAGVSTFVGAIDANGNLDVDGHTELDDVNVSGIATIASLKLASGSTVVAILDEDNFASASDTALATQQSIKTYIDNQLTGSDLDFQGDSGGALSIDLDSETLTIAGTANEIVTSGSGNTLTISLPTTVTNDNFATTAAGRVTTGLIASQNNTDGLTLATGGGKKWLVGRANAEVELYHNNNLKLETTSSGVVVTGISSATSLRLGTSTLVSGVLDEDNMASDSATSLATQQSIKAYVGSQITGGTAQAASVAVQSTSTNSIHYLTFVDSNNGSATQESLLTDGGIQYNPSSNLLSVTGTVAAGTLSLGSGTATAILDEDNMSTDSATALATQQSIKAYVDAEVGAVDVTTSLAGDSGTGSVSTSQTLTINGTTNEVETSVSGQTFTIGLPNTVNVTTAVDVPTIEATNLKARDGTAAITIANSTGAVETASNLTVQGNLIVNGSTTQVDSQAVTIEDQLIELGMVNGSAPTSDLNRDIGVIFNWHDGSNPFKAGVYFDDSTGRIVAAKKVSENAGVLTNNEGAAFEAAEYYVSGCSGIQRVFGCSSGEIILENTTIDAGAF